MRRVVVILLAAVLVMSPGACETSVPAVAEPTPPFQSKTAETTTPANGDLTFKPFSSNDTAGIVSTTGNGSEFVFLVASWDAPAEYRAKADLLGDTGATIQKAIDSVANGTIQLVGTFTITDNITLAKSNIHFIAAAGNGSATLNFTTSTFYVTGSRHSKINNISFKGIRWIGSGHYAQERANHNNSLIYVEFVDNLTITHNYADSTQGTPFFIGTIGGQEGGVENINVIFAHNYVANAKGGYGVIFNTVRDGLIEGNTVLNTRVNAIAASYYGSSRIRVIGNYIRNSGHGAIAMSPGIDSEIIGNTVEGPGLINEGGIEIQSKHAGSPFPWRGSSNVTVAGNTVRGFYWGIYVNGNNGPDDGGIRANNYNNRIYGNTITDNKIGIYLDQYSVDTDIRGNILRENEIDVLNNGTRTVFETFGNNLTSLSNISARR